MPQIASSLKRYFHTLFMFSAPAKCWPIHVDISQSSQSCHGFIQFDKDACKSSLDKTEAII